MSKWADEHRGRVGSTEIGACAALFNPALAHLAKYGNATDLYLRLVHEVEKPWNAAMHRGIDHEQRARELYRSTVGPCTDAPGLIQHPTLPWAVASPDGLSGENIVCEFKTVSIFSRNRWGDPGTDKVPDHYGTQCQWLMECSGREWTHALAMFGRDVPAIDDAPPGFAVEETAIYELPRDASLCAQLAAWGAEFFARHVVAKVPPEILPVNNRTKFKALYPAVYARALKADQELRASRRADQPTAEKEQQS